MSAEPLAIYHPNTNTSMYCPILDLHWWLKHSCIHTRQLQKTPGWPLKNKFCKPCWLNANLHPLPIIHYVVHVNTDILISEVLWSYLILSMASPFSLYLCNPNSTRFLHFPLWGCWPLPIMDKNLQRPKPEVLNSLSTSLPLWRSFGHLVLLSPSLAHCKPASNYFLHKPSHNNFNYVNST